MAYTNAVFYLDYESGVDAARAALTGVTVADNGAGLVRCTKTAHGLVTDAVIDVTLNYAEAWKITVIDANNFDLVGSTYSTSTSVTVTPRGGSSLADAWKTISATGVTAARHAPGDTIRVKASPNPTSLGNATWTNALFWNETGAQAIASSTNATPIVITLSSGSYTLMAPVVGDTVIVFSHSVNTKANGIWTISAVNGSTTITLQDALGANSVGNGVGTGGFARKITNMVVKLASAVTKNIALCGNQGTKPAWAVSANVLPTVSTADFKEGGECMQLAIQAAFTTGLAAYQSVTTLNLSAYQQICFWVKQTAGTIGAAGSISLRLCSDAAGVTAVNTINIPALGALNQWSPIVVDTGAALGNVINSIALYVNTDNGAQTFRLDNIIACKAPSSADSLNLTSLIGKNTGYEAWFGIQSINGTRVMLDQGSTNTIPNSGGAASMRGYSGTSEVVTTYKRETIKLDMVGANVTSQTVTKSGSAGSPIAYSGGWDRTAMTTQNGETWFDLQNGLGYALNGNSVTNLSIDKINFTRCQIGYYGLARDTIGSIAACCTSNNPIFIGSNTSIGSLSMVQCALPATFNGSSSVTLVARADSMSSDGYSATAFTGTVVQANNNTNAGVLSNTGSIIGTILAAHQNANGGYKAGLNSVCNNVVANNNLGAGIVGAAGARVNGGSTSGNSQAGVTHSSGSFALRNVTLNDATPVNVNTFGIYTTVFSEKNGGVVDAHVITTDSGTIVSATDQRHTASGISWKFRPTATTRTSFYPLRLSVAKIAVAANTLVTISIWTRRDSTNIIGKLLVPGYQLAGIPDDVSVTCTPSINTWEQSNNLNITATETGVIEVWFLVWDGVGTTNNFWIDDLVIG